MKPNGIKKKTTHKHTLLLVTFSKGNNCSMYTTHLKHWQFETGKHPLVHYLSIPPYKSKGKNVETLIQKLAANANFQNLIIKLK
jgi:hypothetical protein